MLRVFLGWAGRISMVAQGPQRQSCRPPSADGQGARAAGDGREETERMHRVSVVGHASRDNEGLVHQGLAGDTLPDELARG